MNRSFLLPVPLRGRNNGEDKCDPKKEKVVTRLRKKDAHHRSGDGSREEKGKVGPQVRRSDHWLETAAGRY